MNSPTTSTSAHRPACTTTPDDTEAWLTQSLELAVAHMGDPAPRVYQQLFALSPELEPLFIGDSRGSVRAEMFLRTVETLQDLAAGRPLGRAMVASEWANHQMTGVTSAQFALFFSCLATVCEQAAGADWQPQMAQAWQTTLARAAQAMGAGPA